MPYSNHICADIHYSLSKKESYKLNPCLQSVSYRSPVQLRCQVAAVLTFEIINILVSGRYRLVTIPLLSELENALKQRISKKYHYRDPGNFSGF